LRQFGPNTDPLWLPAGKGSASLPQISGGRMRVRIVALGLLAMLASPARAENWRPSSGTGEIIAYIDSDAIRRKGDEVRFWRQLRWPEPQTLPNGARFDRATALYKGNCRTMTFQSLRNRMHLGDRLLFDGKDDNHEIHSAEPGSNGEADMRAACFGEWKIGK
jgi:hypothetical protein